MDSSADAQEQTSPRKRFTVIVVAVMVVAAAMLGYIGYLELTAPDSSTPIMIANGDLVTLDYIGRLPDGKVFDTSIYSVVLDDTLYPKSLTFAYRSNESYKPFSMTAGLYGAGGTIEGFAMGVIGMSVGDHKVIDVPPGQGYEVDPAMVSSIDLVQELPVRQIVPVDEYIAEFNINPVPMDVVQDPFYNWDLMVSNVSDGNVTLIAQPNLYSIIYPYGNPELSDVPEGWAVLIAGYDTEANGGVGVITLEHGLTAEDVFNRKGTDADGKTFVISALDAVSGTIQISYVDSTSGYNGEIAGRHLTFEVTIISVVQENPYS